MLTRARLCRAFIATFDIEPHAQSIADLIWLAWRLNGASDETLAIDSSTVTQSPNDTESIKVNSDEKDKSEVQASALLDGVAQEAGSRVRLFPFVAYGRRETSQVPATLIKVPAGEALPQRRLLDRALKPFQRRYLSRRSRELDLIATAEASAERRAIAPVYRATLERWFDIALLVEVSDGMYVWDQTLRELQKLLDRHGAFRRVRLWRYAVREGRVVLSSGSGAPTAPRAIADIHGRCIALFPTNGTSPEWRRGPLLDFIEHLGRAGPTAIVQMMPRRIWAHTVLGDSDDEVRSLRPGTPTGRLHVYDQFTGRYKRAFNALTVPVLTLDPVSLQKWARFAMSIRDTNHSAMHLDVCDPDSVRAAQSATRLKTQSPAGLLTAFRSVASPEAYQLLRLLAGVPLSLPIMRLMQMGMDGERAQSQLAEVVLSGLIERSASNDPNGSIESAIFEFTNGIREELLSSLSVDEARLINRSLRPIEERIRQFVEQQTDRSIKDFRALLVDPTGTENLDASVQTFLSVSRRIYQQRGLIADVVNDDTNVQISSVKSPPTSRGSLTQDEIKRAAAVSSSTSQPIATLRTVLLFSTLRQRTWLVASNTALMFMLDDERTRSENRLLQGLIGWLDAIPPDAGKNEKDEFTVGFGSADMPRWYYSATLFPNPNSLETEIISLVPGGPSGPIAQLRRLAIEYELTRKAVKPGPKRTLLMTDIVAKMSALLPTDSLDVELNKSTTSDGNKLVAVVALQRNFDANHVDWLVQQLTQDHAFLAFQAANALLNAIVSLTDVQSQKLRRAVTEVKSTLKSRKQYDHRVHELLDDILLQLDARDALAVARPSKSGFPDVPHLMQSERVSLYSEPQYGSVVRRIRISIDQPNLIPLQLEIESYLEHNQGHRIVRASNSSFTNSLHQNIVDFDVYVCILGDKYDDILKETVSNTEQRPTAAIEYEEARRLGKQVLVFMQETRDYLSVEDLRGVAIQLHAFKTTLLAAHNVHDFKTLEDLVPTLLSALEQLPLRSLELARKSDLSEPSRLTWESYLEEGITHANSRKGRASDIAALHAYDRALIGAPDSLPDNRLAKLLTYRAAMLKRVRRLKEAEADLNLSLDLATEDRERLDAHYNLACVCALQHRPDEMYEHLQKLLLTDEFILLILHHVKDYFAEYENDSIFRSLMLRPS